MVLTEPLAKTEVPELPVKQVYPDQQVTQVSTV